jgi:hypothetical protein
VVYATLVVEDVLQEAVAHKIIASEKIPLAIHRTLGMQGSGFIDANLARLAQASSHGTYIVVRDLDRHECAPALRRKLLDGPVPPGLLVAIAVKEAEAWLLADSPSFRRFFSVHRIEGSPEWIDEPKERLVSLARSSRKRSVREGVVPRGTARVGDLYNAILLDFIKSSWRVERARRRAPSLERFVQRLSALGAGEGRAS